MDFENQISINDYENAKNILSEAIDNNIKNIFLVGSGGNGKTFLIKELHNRLTSNNYNIMFESFLYFETENSFTELLNDISKKILECQIDPFHKFRINIPNDTVVINMNNIAF